MRYFCMFFLLLFMLAANITLANERDLQPDEILSIQKFAVCQCLAQSYKGTDVAVDAQSAAGGYFEAGANGVELYLSIQDFSEKWAKNKKYRSKHGSDLSIMKCLDLYGNKELVSLIRKRQ